MSASIEEATLFEAKCAECSVSSGPHTDEWRAAEWAANHDAECHAVDDGLDDAYEAFREFRNENGWGI